MLQMMRFTHRYTLDTLVWYFKERYQQSVTLEPSYNAAYMAPSPIPANSLGEKYEVVSNNAFLPNDYRASFHIQTLWSLGRGGCTRSGQVVFDNTIPKGWILKRLWPHSW
jgi:hypothetical protein